MMPFVLIIYSLKIQHYKNLMEGQNTETANKQSLNGAGIHITHQKCYTQAWDPVLKEKLQGIL